MKFTKGVSVLICCYNSSKKISPTLAHLFAQKFNKAIAWEIILVDNGSKDDTLEIAKRAFQNYSKKRPIDFTLLSEPTPGKSAALEKAIATAKYTYLTICDDDNWLNDNYIEKAFQLMEERPNIGIIGGLCLPEFETHVQPEWMNQYIGGYACGNPKQTEGFVNDVVGAGMVIRNEVLSSINQEGFKSILSSKRGRVITNGEDTELCKAFNFTDYTILYSPELVLKHFIPQEKLNWLYCKRLFASFGHSEVLLELYTFANRDGYPKNLPKFYWLKKFLYFLILPFKYYFKYYKNLNKEGHSAAILFLTWKLKRNEYLSLNFKLNTYYQDILMLKHKLSQKSSVE